MTHRIKAGLTDIRRLIAVMSAGILLASGTSLLLAAPAQAFPYNCTTGIVANGGVATCNNGTGQFQVAIGCKNVFGFYENKTGPWRNVGAGTSNANCSFGYTIQWVGYHGRG